MLAAIIHDVSHPGVTNDFRVAEGDGDALTYNDRSVNENLHASLGFRTMQDDACNWLGDLTRAQRASIRKIVCDVVLSTDMAGHFGNLKAFNAICDSSGTDITKRESTTAAIELIVHASDISNVSKPRFLSLRWTDAVLEEFFAQGDREKAAGRNITPLCDRNTVSKAGSQVGFVDFVVAPTFEALNKIADVALARQYIKEYREYWQQELAKEKAAKEAAGAGGGMA